MDISFAWKTKKSNSIHEPLSINWLDLHSEEYLVLCFEFFVCQEKSPILAISLWWRLETGEYARESLEPSFQLRRS